LGATAGTGRLIVRFRRGHGSLEGDLPRVDMMERDARDQGTLTCSLVVKGAENPCLMHDAEAFPLMQRVEFSRVQEPTYCRTIRTI
jgi:hypothetical protein